MGRLIETVGKYAENSYYIAQADITVHCVEELCFALCQNAFLMDKSLMDTALAKWLDTECGLPELSREMMSLIQKKASPAALASAILEYVGYGTKREREEVEDLFRKSTDMDASSRRKALADYLVGNKKFSQAVMEYDRILEEVPSMDHMIRAELFHNKGVALCRLFFFREAAEAFLRAYREDPDRKESALQYLMALRMSLSEEDYIAFIADNKMWYEQSLEVEKRMEMCRIGYEGSEEYQKLQDLLTRKDVAFYEELSKLVVDLKGKYRKEA